METIAIRDILITPQQELKIDKKSTMKFLSRINAGSFGGIFKGQLDEKNKRTGRIQKERVRVNFTRAIFIMFLGRCENRSDGV